MRFSICYLRVSTFFTSWVRQSVCYLDVYVILGPELTSTVLPMYFSFVLLLCWTILFTWRQLSVERVFEEIEYMSSKEVCSTPVRWLVLTQYNIEAFNQN